MRKSPQAERRHLSKEISTVLIVKFSLILLAGFTIFGAHNRVHVDAAKIAAQLLGGR